MKYRRNRTRKRLDKVRFVTKTTILWPLVIVFIISNIMIVIKSSTLGAELVGVEKRISTLVDQKKALETEILKQSSLISIKQKADKMDFQKAQNILYMERDVEIAKLDL